MPLPWLADSIEFSIVLLATTHDCGMFFPPEKFPGGGDDILVLAVSAPCVFPNKAATATPVRLESGHA
jgi:hypothetical protein